MRHRHGYNRLGRDPIHRRALLKNMAIALVKHERIVTTLGKAKEFRRTGDMMIGLAKKDTEHSRKKAWNWLRHPDLMDKLFGTLRQRYLTRPGGYTRVLRAPNRKGDNAPMAVVELVENRFPPLRAGRDSLRGSLPLLMDNEQKDLSSALGGLDLNTDTSPGVASSESGSDSIPVESSSSSTMVSSGKSRPDPDSSRAELSPGGRRQRPFHHDNEKDLGTPV